MIDRWRVRWFSIVRLNPLHQSQHVSDLDKSLAFYHALGYTDSKPVAETGTIEEARAYGLDKPFRIKGADISLGRGDHHVLRMVQWIDPYNADPAYPPPVNHIGIDRIAGMLGLRCRVASTLPTLTCCSSKFLTTMNHPMTYPIILAWRTPRS